MMSSSAEFTGLTWDTFSERPAQAPAEFVSPSSEVAAVLQRYRSDVEAARSQTRAAVEDAREAAAQQAVLVAQLDAILSRAADGLTAAGQGSVHKRLRVLKDQMLDTLGRGGITVQDPTGRPLAEVWDRVEVVGWRHVPELTAKLVVATLEPIVLYGKAPIRRGRVIAGTPSEEEQQ
jgi:hypothetical protein